MIFWVRMSVEREREVRECITIKFGTRTHCHSKDDGYQLYDTC